MLPPPRAILARLVAFSLIATALPLNLPATLAPAAASSPQHATKEARGAILQQFSSDGQAPVGPGVDHTWGKIVTGSGQQVVNMVTIQPAAPGITIEAGLSNDAVLGLEKSTNIANRKSAEGHRALAAINGDVWSSSGSGAQAAPFGIHIANGELMVAGPTARPTFGIDASGRAIIGAPVVSTNLLTPDGGFHEISRINQRRQASELVLYTPRFGSQTDPDASGTEVVLSGVPLPLATTVNSPAVVAEVRPANGGTPIAPGTVVVTGPDTSFLSTLVPGETLTLTISITAEWQTVTQALGGREFLLRAGNTFISPHPDIADQRHPRTGIGITADGGVILATVDGRDAGRSTGVTDAEFAALLRERGAIDAINLDGGGSTAMSVREPGDGFVSVVNRPSDGAERSVPNSLLVFSSAPTGPLASVTITPDNQTVYATKTIDFNIFGQDAAYNPVTFSSSAVQWSVAGVDGAFDAAGRFTPTTARNDGPDAHALALPAASTARTEKR
jgi:exopolysaccharide biosynthesis protein